MFALFGKDKLPLVVAKRQQIAVVAEVKELMPWAGRLAGEGVGDVVSVEMDLEGLVADLHTLEQLLLRVGHANRRHDRRDHIFVGQDVVEDSAGLDDPRPTNRTGDAEAAFPVGSLFIAKWGRAAIRPGKLLRPVRGGLH